jgi:hypothetical protein
MPLTFPYRFAVAMFAEDGTSLGTVALKRDWEPVYEWTRFYFQRRGQLSLGANGSASVLPVWEKTLGEPYCGGYRIQIRQPGHKPVAREFPKTHFREFASALASVFVEQKKLHEGEHYSYLVIAQPAPAVPESTSGLRVSDASPPVPAREASLNVLLATSIASGTIDDGDMPVFVARQVLEEAALLTRAHEGIETGGILIGRLGHDHDVGEIFVEITAQIPAEYTRGNDVKLSFTPETWTAADAALRLRNRGEIFVGYFHSHPVSTWCRTRSCTLEAQRNCPFAKDFFSVDDEAVMRAAFPSPWSIAIVANDIAFTDLTFSMFGNREGFTKSRGFYVLEGTLNGA